MRSSSRGGSVSAATASSLVRAIRISSPGAKKSSRPRHASERMGTPHAAASNSRPDGHQPIAAIGARAYRSGPAMCHPVDKGSGIPPGARRSGCARACGWLRWADVLLRLAMLAWLIAATMTSGLSGYAFASFDGGSGASSVSSLTAGKGHAHAVSRAAATDNDRDDDSLADLDYDGDDDVVPPMIVQPDPELRPACAVEVAAPTPPADVPPAELFRPPRPASV